MRYIISGGGTGGHIFPAVAIGKAIMKTDPDAKILFVGAENRMEMERVPKEGFDIVGLPVAGFSRKNLLKNIPVLIKLGRSMLKARSIIKNFKPDIAIGVGGYASGPVLKEAQRQKIPTLIQEQNSYAGVTNKMLAKKADVICVAYDNMNRFFPESKLKKTGNPLRESISIAKATDSIEAKAKLGFDPSKPLIVAMGGSLGAKTINEAIEKSLPVIKEKGYSLLWQTGKRFFSEYESLSNDNYNNSIRITAFIDNMDLVYAAADIVISRAGATTISELQYLGKPAVLIPSPNVAEDHQRKNAEALVLKGAAMMILDNEAVEKLPQMLSTLPDDKNKLSKLACNAAAMGKYGADMEIARMACELAKHVKQ